MFLKGVCSQRFNMRLPIGVTHISKIAARVFSVPPARFCVISKFRRVAASKMTLSFCFSITILRMWGNEVRCVSFTYCSKQPAARRALWAFSTPNPTKSLVPNCKPSCCFAVSSSYSHNGRRRNPLLCSISDMLAKSSGYSNSAGRVR